MAVPEIADQDVQADPIPSDRTFTGHPVKLPLGSGASAFEGPLDLLIYLIERDQIDIFDIPIEHITQQYLDYLSALESLNIEVAGEFLVMAAELLQIKSRMLLPQEQRPDQEEEETGDPRAELAARLLEYRRYKAVAHDLRARAQLQSLMFSRPAPTNGNGHTQPDQPYLLLNDVSSFDLWAAFQSVLSRVKEPPSGDLVRPRFTVAQKMAAIAARLRWAKSGVRFIELFDDATTRIELIVTFLALLELIRLRRLRVAQERNFGEIWVHPMTVSESE